MNPPTKPGQRCNVIGGRMPFNCEGESPNKGKVVTTMFLHPIQAGVEMENVWHCAGENIQTYYGVGNEADFLECWLELAEPPPVTSKQTEREVQA
jgi:hypothetical protein